MLLLQFQKSELQLYLQPQFQLCQFGAVYWTTETSFLVIYWVWNDSTYICSSVSLEVYWGLYMSSIFRLKCLSIDCCQNFFTKNRYLNLFPLLVVSKLRFGLVWVISVLRLLLNGTLDLRIVGLCVEVAIFRSLFNYIDHWVNVNFTP